MNARKYESHGHFSYVHQRTCHGWTKAEPPDPITLSQWFDAAAREVFEAFTEWTMTCRACGESFTYTLTVEQTAEVTRSARQVLKSTGWVDPDLH